MDNKWHDPNLDDADISLAPIDVGFDPRVHDMACRVPRTVTAVRYETQADRVEDREIAVAHGTIEQIVAELEAAGYRVEVSGK